MTPKNILRKATYFFPYHFYAKRKVARTDRIKLMGFTLTVSPSVFHPQLFFSSKILGEFIKTIDLRQKELLDMGTGSGLIGMCAASCGAKVLGVDLNPAAVDCATRNVKMNMLDDRMEVLVGNLFEGLQPGQTYDFIVWNPPFYPSQPDSMASIAWRTGKDHEIILRFAEQAKSHMRKDGSLILILSSDMRTDEVVSMFSSRGYAVYPRMSRRKLFETFTIYEFKTDLS